MGVFFCYNKLMATDKVKENSKKTTERLEKQAESDHKRQLLAKLEEVRATQLATMQALAKFLAGHTTKTEVVNQLKSIATPDALKVVAAVKALQKDINGKEVDWSPVLPWLEKISEHLEAIPKEHPEMPEQQQVDMTRTNGLLESFGIALANMKLVAEAPIVNVNVPKTELKIEKVDLKELKKPLADILEAFQSFEVPPVQFTDMSEVQSLLEKSNELLEKIVKKPSGGGGGGGGGMVPYKDPNTGFSIQVTLNADGSIPVANADGSPIGGGAGLTDAQLRAAPVGVILKGSSQPTFSLSSGALATAWMDVLDYSEISITMLTNPSAAVHTFQFTDDPAKGNITSGAFQLASATGGAFVNNTTSANLTYKGSRGGRYFRVLSALTGANVSSLAVNLYPASGYPNNTVGSVASAYGVNSANPGSAFPMMASDGTNLQLLRMNEALTLLASAARTTTQTSADLLNYNGMSAIQVFLNVTVSAPGDITLKIQGKDPASAAYYDILVGANVTATGFYRYKVSPIIPSVANLIAQDHLPKTFRIVVTANTAGSMTYSVGYVITRGI